MQVYQGHLQRLHICAIIILSALIFECYATETCSNALVAHDTTVSIGSCSQLIVPKVEHWENCSGAATALSAELGTGWTVEPTVEDFGIYMLRVSCDAGHENIDDSLLGYELLQCTSSPSDVSINCRAYPLDTYFNADLDSCHSCPNGSSTHNIASLH